MVRKHGRYVFAVVAIIMVFALFIGCTQTPETPSVPSGSGGSAEPVPSITPGTEPNSTAPIRPDLPPIETLTSERLNLPYAEMEIAGKYREIEIHYFDGDILYCSLIDMRANGDLLETEGIIAYDVVSEETEIYEYTEGNRILSFAVLGENIYYTSIGYGEETYNWSLIKSDLRFTGKTVLISGDMPNPRMAPEVIMKDGKLYLVSLDETAERGVFAVSEITGDNLRQIMSVDSAKERWGNFLTVRVTDGLAYYMAFDEIGQHIKKTDLATGVTETLYTLQNGAEALYGFVPTEKILFVSSRAGDRGMTIHIKFPDREMSYVYEEGRGIENTVQNGKIIIHADDVFLILGETGEPERRFEISGIDPVPFYTVYDKDTILVQDTRSCELFFCDIA